MGRNYLLMVNILILKEVMFSIIRLDLDQFITDSFFTQFVYLTLLYFTLLTHITVFLCNIVDHVTDMYLTR